jgi:hypothetical protein
MTKCKTIIYYKGNHAITQSKSSVAQLVARSAVNTVTHTYCLQPEGFWFDPRRRSLHPSFLLLEATSVFAGLAGEVDEGSFCFFFYCLSLKI